MCNNLAFRTISFIRLQLLTRPESLIMKGIVAGLSTFATSYQRGSRRTARLSFNASCKLDWREQSVGVLTEAGSVPAVVVWGAAGDTVVAQQPITCHFAPQADAADARLEVSGAALTVWAAPCGEEQGTVNTTQRLCLAAQNQKQTPTFSELYLAFLETVTMCLSHQTAGMMSLSRPVLIWGAESLWAYKQGGCWPTSELPGCLHVHVERKLQQQ